MAPWLVALMIAAPASVAVSLLVGRSVVLVFVIYHVIICLLVPLVVNVRLRGWKLRRHLQHIGIAGPGVARALATGVAVGLATAVALGAVLETGRDWLPGSAVLDKVLARWGAAPGRTPEVLLFVALVNGPAEELFWRGFVAAELRTVRCRVRRLLLPSVAYASYHVLTIPALVPVPGAAVLMLGGVLGAGLGWAWLRERTGSTWPAVLSHAAAAAVYTVYAGPLALP